MFLFPSFPLFNRIIIISSPSNARSFELSQKFLDSKHSYLKGKSHSKNPKAKVRLKINHNIHCRLT